MIEKSLVLVKPDGVRRGLIGEIIKRFEQRGLKIVGMKMVHVDEDFAKKHYREELALRRGEKVRQMNVDFLKEGPIVAIGVEGVDAIETVRKIVGDTEPKKAMPGTIRGDFCHVSYEHANEKESVVRNIIHASANKEDAKIELKLWFDSKELHDYRTSHQDEVF